MSRMVFEDARCASINRFQLVDQAVNEYSALLVLCGAGIEPNRPRGLIDLAPLQ